MEKAAAVSPKKVPASVENGGHRLPDSTLKAILAILSASFIFLLGWMLSQESRVSAIEGSRFTAREGSELRADLYERLSSMEQRIVAQIPPSWLKEDMQEIKIALREMQTRLNSLEAKANNDR